MEKFSIYNLDPNTIDLYIDCFDDNGDPKKKENVEWQFLDNPEKISFVDIARDEEQNKTAGIYAISCIRFKINGKVVLGSQSLDTITSLDYRGTGLFIKLANDVYEKAQNSVALVYGFPNGNSIRGFEKKLSWDVLDPVPFLIKPLKTKYFSDKIKGIKFLPNINLSPFNYKAQKGYKISEAHEFPLAVNKLWEDFSLNFKVSVHRDKAYLDWRYIQKPNEEYKIAHCYKDEKYLGFVIYTVKEKHQGKIAYIMELIYDLKDEKAGEVLLKYAISKIKEQKADCILSWCLEHSPNYKVFKKLLFFNLPEKLRPIELHFGARPFKSEFKDLISDRSNWYISYSDSDTV